jgi:hypothetical protein
MNNDVLDKHMDTLFRITHEATFNVTIQALVLIEKVAESRPVSDRFGALFLHYAYPVLLLGSASKVLAHVVCVNPRPAVGSLIETSYVSQSTFQIPEARQECGEGKSFREALLTGVNDWTRF